MRKKKLAKMQEKKKSISFKKHSSKNIVMLTGGRGWSQALVFVGYITH